jgi:hypothetical protein
MNLPSVKTNPVLIALVVVLFTFVYTIACLTGGWWLRAMSESRAELAVVVDDGNFMQALEIQTQKWVEEFNDFDNTFHIENDIPDCLAVPMPEYYHDSDYRVQSEREQAQ